MNCLPLCRRESELATRIENLIRERDTLASDAQLLANTVKDLQAKLETTQKKLEAALFRQARQAELIKDLQEISDGT